MRKAIFVFILCCVSLATKAQSSQEDWSKAQHAEYGFTIGSFDDIKNSGSYGWTNDLLCKNIGQNLYLGANIGLICNYGLVRDSDLTFCRIIGGPVITHDITEKVAFTMPMDVTWDFSKNVGLIVSPSICFGGKLGLYIGPAFSMPLRHIDKYTKISTGFRIGLFITKVD